MMKFRNNITNNLWYCFLIFFIVMLLMLTGCGKITISGYIEPEFNQLVNRFYDLKNITHKTKLIVVFGDINKKGVSGSNVIGECDLGNNSPKITIDRKSWQTFSENQKLALMFHELGHCILIRQHDDTKLDDGCPSSIMNSFLPSDYCLDNHLQEYLNNI